MDKHTKRYFAETFHHYSENIEMGEMAGYIQQGGETGYLASAISDHFSGFQRDYLQQMMWNQQFGRDEE